MTPEEINETLATLGMGWEVVESRDPRDGLLYSDDGSFEGAVRMGMNASSWHPHSTAPEALGQCFMVLGRMEKNDVGTVFLKLASYEDSAVDGAQTLLDIGDAPTLSTATAEVLRGYHADS